ncbi:MAG: 50S ribosomal protein L11 methyltransferase [Bacteroidales bacterium]|nr:50S ribosomal protein L11 methyltransferase [Bacteroidales bacterium]
MDYIEVQIEITPFSEDFSDIVVAQIEELGFESYVTEAPYLKAYIPVEQFSERNLKLLLSGIDRDLFELSYTTNFIKEQNWNAVWEASFEPIVIGKCTVKAHFHKGLPRTKYTITITPKMAFGTGHHQTTSLMMEVMQKEEKFIRDHKVLDMGCGTGILAILAAKMKSATPVHAIDIDPTAVFSVRENAWKNRVHEKIDSRCGDASLIQAGKYDIILANINRNILLQDMATYTRGLLPGGVLVISGFYTQDLQMLTEEASGCGLEYEYHLEKENWVAAKFTKK